jgi:putative membrane protein
MRYLLMMIAVSLAFAGSAWAKSDKHFVEKAIKGSNGEIALGHLAEEKGSQGVKDFGKMLVTDHSKSKAEAEKLASTLGIAPTDAMTNGARKEQKKLEKLSGAQFDKEFVKHMVKDHKKDIKAFAKASRGTGDVAKFAAQTLPTLQKHLETAERLSR